MVREYVDFYVKKIDRQVAAALAGMGFKHVCVTDHGKNLSGEEVFKQFGIRVYRKVFFEASSRAELLKRLRKLGRGSVVSIKPLTREALMVAARDGRVATVFVHGEMSEIDRHVIQVFRNCFEISMSEVVESFREDRKLRNLFKIFQSVARYNIPTVISSGASDADKVLPPHQLAYVLAALKNWRIPDLDAVSTIPVKILREVFP